MYYELYVDVLFLVNFVMDYFLLLLVKRMLKCQATHGRICIGAGIGSLLTCVITVIYIPYTFIKLVLFHGLVNTFMIRIGLKIKNGREFVKAFIMLYIGGFLLGGVLGSLRPFVKTGSLFLASAIAGYYVVLGIWNFISHLQKMRQYRCKVELYQHGKCYCVEAMIDTGNGLCDPVTGQPVSILGKEDARHFLGNEKAERFRYIPYHSIGKSGGLLPTVKIDKMCVFREREYWIRAPLIAISEEKISVRGEYSMILNPDLF